MMCMTTDAPCGLCGAHTVDGDGRTVYRRTEAYHVLCSACNRDSWLIWNLLDALDEARTTLGVTSAELEKLTYEGNAAQAIVDANLCAGHANADGLYGFSDGINTTADGGGCVVCLGERSSADHEVLGAVVDEWLSQHCFCPPTRRAQCNKTNSGGEMEETCFFVGASLCIARRRRESE